MIQFLSTLNKAQAMIHFCSFIPIIFLKINDFTNYFIQMNE